VALSLLGAVALMIFGWRSAVPEFVYDPPTWGRHFNMLLMFVSIFLFGAAQGKSRIKQWIRHPGRNADMGNRPFARQWGQSLARAVWRIGPVGVDFDIYDFPQ